MNLQTSFIPAYLNEITILMTTHITPKNQKSLLPWRRIVVWIFVSLACCVLAASIGSVSIHPMETIMITLSKFPFINLDKTWEDSSYTILWEIRFPRILLALLVGASLSVAGATYQGLFRNPLADPYFIGVASGASLGATLVFLTNVPTIIGNFNVLPIAAFIGGTGAVAIAYKISSTSSNTKLATLILAGIAIGSFTTAVTSILMIRTEPDLRPLLSWIMGGFISAKWSDSMFLLPYLIPSFLLVCIYSRILNTIQLDEEYAESLGVNTERTKKVLIIVSTILTAAAVSFSGLIGFVGLVAPHVVRILWGGDYRSLIPTAALVGGSFLVLSDLIARTVVSPGELPVGIITALFGAPFFIFLLVKNRSKIY